MKFNKHLCCIATPKPTRYGWCFDIALIGSNQINDTMWYGKSKHLGTIGWSNSRSSHRYAGIDFAFVFVDAVAYNLLCGISRWSSWNLNCLTNSLGHRM